MQFYYSANLWDFHCYDFHSFWSLLGILSTEQKNEWEMKRGCIPLLIATMLIHKYRIKFHISIVIYWNFYRISGGISNQKPLTRFFYSNKNINLFTLLKIYIHILHNKSHRIYGIVSLILQLRIYFQRSKNEKHRKN